MRRCIESGAALRGLLVLMAFGAFTLLGGCGDDDDDNPQLVEAARIAITGDYVVEVGATVALTATTVNGTDASYTFASDKASVATVDDAGVVTGVAAGVAIITVTGADSGATAERGVVVQAKPATGGTPVVNVTGDYRLEPGKTLQLAAATVNATDGSYAWASSDETVATVDDAGLVTGVADGVAEITATGADSGASGTHGVVVTDQPPAAVATVSVSGDFVVGVGATVALTAATANGEDSAYTWESSNEAAATVADDGTVTGVASGEAVITATGADTGVAGKMGLVVTEDPFIPPFWDEWANGPHADKTAEAFIHWDEDGEISTSCAKCHSEGGFLDFIGADGTDAGVVDNPAAIGTTIGCNACHNATTLELSTVTFPSGAEVSGLGSEARCMQCHQGRNSTVQVDNAIAEAAAADDDTVSDALGFQNIHYLAAGATLYGGIAMGAYQYEAHMYDSRNRHVAEKDTCLDCHNPHTLEVRIDSCSKCHDGVTTVEDLADVRMFGSTGDYDGDGDTSEGIKAELEGLAAVLYETVQAYGTEGGAAIAYDSHAYPYFFNDTNGNGTADEEEANYGNQYKSWTPRLLRAAYNYQYYLKDPGAYAHNPKYVLQTMHDSVMDLNSSLTAPVPYDGDRTDAGHFAGSHEAWRHWDEDGEVSASCSKCHSGEGFKFYTEFGATAPQPVGNGLACLTCHSELEGFSLREVNSVTFPSGITITDEGNPDNICATCHSGRESKATIDQAIADDKLGFKNVHYLAAAATLFGSEAQVGYEFDGKTYAGKWSHTGGNGCTKCHSPEGTEHTFDVQENAESCKGCHQSTDISSFRLASTADYDGDNNATEPLADEIATLGSALYAAIQAAATADGNPIVYEGHSYPYFFKDNNGNGVADPDEANYGNKYGAWTPALMKAAFNYQHSLKETGAWAHNFAYIAQLMIDSIEALGGDVSSFTRP